MSRPRLLDLFCKAGGAGAGYALAGFEVVGVDIEPQPHYPFTFIQADALTFPLDGYEVAHASVPCQAYSCTRSLWKKDYPNLIPTMRERFASFRGIWMIENVVGAPLPGALQLCGSMFGLRVKRHRLFESNLLLFAPGVCRHRGTVRDGSYVTVAGHDFHAEEGRQAMGIDWMTRDELAQAIPPAYTEWLGKQVKAVL